MKKPAFAIAAVCAATCCLTACNLDDGYGALNKKLKLNYSTVTLTVTDIFDEGASLESKYNMAFSDDAVTVTYTQERFAELSLDGFPSDSKTVISGEAVIKDGAVTSGDIGVSGILPDGLNFKEEYFENASLSETSFKADVKNAAGFFDTGITCTDMKVTAYFKDALTSITVTYISEKGNSVKYRYEFTL